MLTFHPLTVSAVERVADDAVCISIAVPPALRTTFAYQAGQYVTVRRSIEGREERRTYSLVTAPGGELLRIGVRVQPQGRMSRQLGQDLRAGDVLEVGTPAGRFGTPIDRAREFSYVAFASGSGITPVLSLVSEILAKEAVSRVTLIYGNRSVSRAMFLEETLSLKDRYLGRFAVHFVMSREPQETAILNGRIDGPKVRELAGHLEEIATADEYFVCGPGTMVEDVKGALRELNGSARVRFERFMVSAGGLAPPLAAPEVREPLSTISITMDGRRRSFAMDADAGSVLEAAERAGVDLPFSCRSGVCASCRARVTAGEAVMTHNIALAPWEVDAGFVLCCQARPTTSKLELTYDEK